MASDGVSRAPVEARLKRIVDVTVAAAALVAASPLLLLAAVAVVLEDGRPVLFSQERAGLHGRTFRLWKLRSMCQHDVPPAVLGQVGSAHPLVTRVGRVLRRSKLDELPQLINVLRGDMSLVGPRPALPEDVRAYDAFQRRRLQVRPGMTGWAQINGNVGLSWDERILLDVWYIDHWSFGLDLRILARTVALVATGERRRPSTLEEARAHAERTRRGG